MPNKNLIYGFHPVIEALDAGKEFHKILIQKNKKDDSIKSLIKKIIHNDLPFSFVPKETLDRLVNSNHQGIVAFISPFEYQKLNEVVLQIFEKGESPFIFLLDHITDVRNMGAIARSAAAMNVHALIVPLKGGALLNEVVMKTSAGGLGKIPVCREKNLLETVKFLKQSGLTIFAATEKKGVPINRLDFKNPFVVVIGAEDKGISHDLLKMVDRFITIPLNGKISSLNVSVAAGIIAYEVNRQRNN